VTTHHRSTFTCLLVASVFLSFPVQPGSEIGQFQTRGHPSAFGVHRPTYWSMIPPLACSSVHVHPHHLVRVDVGDCSVVPSPVPHSPWWRTHHCHAASGGAPLDAGQQVIPGLVMKSASIAVTLRVDSWEPEVHGVPRSLCVSSVNFDSRSVDAMERFERRVSYAGFSWTVWEDSGWNRYSEVHNGENISTWTTGPAEILVEQLGSAATDAHPATQMAAVQYWKEVLGSGSRSCSAVIDC
jgi:hypothetical protein